LLPVWLLLPALAKFSIVPSCADWDIIPVPEMLSACPEETVTVSPELDVKVAVPLIAFTFTPHSSSRSGGSQGIIIISIVAAKAAVEGSTSSPAATTNLVQRLNGTCILFSVH
jgi:hypothetical protein